VAFRFRAAAALDVRRREEDAAHLASANAELAASAAAQRSCVAREKVAHEARRLIDTQQAGTEAWRVQWHRAWIDTQRRDAELRAGEHAERAAEAARAVQGARDAMKRRRVLERLRDRSWRKYQRTVHEQHVRDMNELATLRFVARSAEQGDTRAD